MSYKTEFKTAPMEGRLAWCFLDQPRTKDMNAKAMEQPRYECSFYFPKTNSDPRQCRNYAFFAQLALDVVQNAYRGQWPMIGAGGAWTDWPIDDCDVPAVAEKYPWARGMWSVRLSAGKYRPRVFDAGNNPIEPGVDGKFRYGAFKGGDGIGGDWAMVSVNAYAWEYGASRRGVSFGVEGIKVTRQDEQIIIGGVGRPVEQMFGAPTGQPVYGGAPPLPGPPAQGGYGAPPAPQYGAPLASQYGAPPQGGPAPNPTSPGPYYAPTAGFPASSGQAPSYVRGAGFAATAYPSSGGPGMPPPPPSGGGGYDAPPAPQYSAPGMPPSSPPSGGYAPPQGGYPPLIGQR